MGVSPTRVHQLLSDPGAALVDHAISALRELGWPAPEDPGNDDRELVADRLVDEAALLMTSADWPDTDNIAVDHARVVRILRRIADDVGELARAKRLADLSSADIDADPRLGRHRRLAEPAIEFPKGPKSVLHLRQAWEDYERRLRQAGLPLPPNPWRHLGPL